MASAPAQRQASVVRRGLKRPEISSKMAGANSGWGGPRRNSGGTRPNSGGLRPNAGRPRKAIISRHDVSELRWFIYRTYPHAEQQSVRELARAGWNAYMPMCEEYRIDRVVPTMRHIVSVPYWSGYGCVEFDRTSRVWPTILQVDGVRAIMGDRWGRPFPVKRGWIEGIQASGDSRRLVRKVILPPIEPGTKMQVGEDSPFADMAGVCLWSDQTRVRISANFLGGLREITVPRNQVRVIEEGEGGDGGKP